MPISRTDLGDAGSPEVLVKRILQAEPNLPAPVPIQELCAPLGILRIEDLDADGFEGGLVTDAKRFEGVILAKRGGEPRCRFTIARTRPLPNEAPRSGFAWAVPVQESGPTVLHGQGGR